ncbi:MAG: hypothetical protein B7Z62_04325 [Deltaproteobacteria bacterium 37-65-8]|nr:MAG: hypothetical protein B7Z62_04325 [Deltaproteobacteria bacterium 37-65-8]
MLSIARHGRKVGVLQLPLRTTGIARCGKTLKTCGLSLELLILPVDIEVAHRLVVFRSAHRGYAQPASRLTRVDLIGQLLLRTVVQRTLWIKRRLIQLITCPVQVLHLLTGKTRLLADGSCSLTVLLTRCVRGLLIRLVIDPLLLRQSLSVQRCRCILRTVIVLLLLIEVGLKSKVSRC